MAQPGERLDRFLLFLGQLLHEERDFCFLRFGMAVREEKAEDPWRSLPFQRFLLDEGNLPISNFLKNSPFSLPGDFP